MFVLCMLAFLLSRVINVVAYYGVLVSFFSPCFYLEVGQSLCRIDVAEVELNQDDAEL